jgi:RNA-binding protein
MNKLVHSIQINVLEKNEENLEKIHQSFSFLLPIDYEKEKIYVTYKKLTGLQHNIIHSLTLTTNKERHNTVLAESIFSNIDKDIKSLLVNQIESRLDEDGFFYIRFDKNALFNRLFQLTDSGDCFHIKIKIAGFPAKRPSFIRSIQTLIK